METFQEGAGEWVGLSGARDKLQESGIHPVGGWALLHGYIVNDGIGGSRMVVWGPVMADWGQA